MKFILCLFRYPFIIGSCVDMQRLDNNPVINSQKTEHAGKDSLRITQKLGLIEYQYRVFGKIFQVSLQLFYIDTSFNVCDAVLSSSLSSCFTASTKLLGSVNVLINGFDECANLLCIFHEENALDIGSLKMAMSLISGEYRYILSGQLELKR